MGNRPSWLAGMSPSPAVKRDPHTRLLPPALPCANSVPCDEEGVFVRMCTDSPSVTQHPWVVLQSKTVLDGTSCWFPRAAHRRCLTLATEYSTKNYLYLVARIVQGKKGVCSALVWHYLKWNLSSQRGFQGPKESSQRQICNALTVFFHRVHLYHV